MEKVCVLPVELDGPAEVQARSLEDPHAIVGDAPVVVGVGIERLGCDGQGVVGDGLGIEAQLVVRKAAVEKGLEVGGMQGQGFGVGCDGFHVAALLAQCVALGVAPLRLRLCLC